MNINATLVIQVIHFFIAYLLFRFILLKPAYGAIREDEAAKVSLEQLIADDKRLVEERRQKISEQWRESSIFFQKYLPGPVEKLFFLKKIMPKVKHKPIQKEVVEKTRKQVSEAIVTAIGVADDRL